jgi:hypothetical protein
MEPCSEPYTQVLNARVASLPTMSRSFQTSPQTEELRMFA